MLETDTIYTCKLVHKLVTVSHGTVLELSTKYYNSIYDSKIYFIKVFGISVIYNIIYDSVCNYIINKSNSLKLKLDRWLPSLILHNLTMKPAFQSYLTFLTLFDSKMFMRHFLIV